MMKTFTTRHRTLLALVALLGITACEEEYVEPKYEPAAFEALRFSEVSQPIEGVAFDADSISLLEGVPVRVTVEARLDVHSFGTDRYHYFTEEREDGTYFELQSADPTIVDVSETQQSRGNGGCTRDEYGYDNCYGATGVFEYVFIPRRSGTTKLTVIWRDESVQQLPMTVAAQPATDDDDASEDDDKSDDDDDAGE